jgi:hypothetical protein
MAHPVKNALRFLEETVIFEGVENVNLSTGVTPSGSCVCNEHQRMWGEIWYERFLQNWAILNCLAT